MSFKITISEAAEADLRDAFLWYEDKSENLSNRFEKDFRDTVKKIKENPLIFQIRYSQIRIAFLNKFPYGLHFTIKNKEIIIIAFFHSSQSPKKWIER